MPTPTPVRSTRRRTPLGPWLLAAALPALAATSAAADIRLAADVAGAGGGVAAGGGLRLAATLGQPVVGRSRGAAGQLASGFWAAAPGISNATPTASTTPGASPTAAPPTVTPTPTGPGLWVVTTSVDVDDGVCAPAPCALREALNAANDHPGPDRIAFAIPAGDPGCAPDGTCTIRPAAPLPALVDAATTIDGFSQPGARPNTAPAGAPLDDALRIVLDGAHLPCCASGLVLRGDGQVVRGLVVHGFQVGLGLRGGAGSRIEGNHLGADALGVAAPGNRCQGLLIEVDPGAAPPRDHTIGGLSPAARNLVAGNACTGIEIGAASGVQVLGNIVGADASGAKPLPNSYSGVRLFGGASGSRIGGDDPAASNTIAFNGSAGIEVNGSFGPTVGHTLRGNRIHDNDGPGIALIGGGNHGLAAPVILFAASRSARGTACGRCVVEVFSDAADEGGRFEGYTRADADGTWQLSVSADFAGPNLTATATDDRGDTSAFAAAVEITSPTPTATPTVSPTPTPGAGPSASATPTPGAGPSRTPAPTTTPSATPGARPIWLPIAARSAGGFAASAAGRSPAATP